MIRLLEPKDKEIIKSLFCSQKEKYMGVVYNLFETKEIPDFNVTAYEMFCEAYLSNLSNFHAMGYFDKTGNCLAYISFYESDDEPAWYFTMIRSKQGLKLLRIENITRDMLDEVIEYNEKNGRCKYYTLISKRHTRLTRRFGFSDYNNERYGYFDEGIIPAKTKPIYQNYWEILVKRSLIPVDSIVRCSFLKQEYRDNLPICGNI